MSLAHDFPPLVTDWMIKTVARIAPSAGHRAMYGGLVFERDLGSAKTGFCGLFTYTEHLSIEFSQGAALDDPLHILEGNGKLRRHIKIRSMGDILAKDVEGYIARAFHQGETA